MVEYYPNRVSCETISVKEHNSLNPRGGYCFKLGIATLKILQRLGDQDFSIDFIYILCEGEQNFLYHVGVFLNTSRGSATKDKAEIHFTLLI